MDGQSEFTTVKSKQVSAASKIKPKVKKGASAVKSAGKSSESVASDEVDDYFDDDIHIPAAKKIKSAIIPIPVLAVSSDSSDSSEEAGSKPVSSVYQIRPIRGLFGDEENLNKYTADVVSEIDGKRPDLPPILQSVNDVRALKMKLNKIPLRKFHFTQFTYKAPIRLAAVTNMYGAFVSTQEAFNERKNIYDMAHLEAKHRLSMLLPSVDHWWHEPSKQLMREFINTKLLNDLKAISTKDVFSEAINKFKIPDAGQCWRNLREKILSSTKVTNEGTVPGVWNVKIPNTKTLPSQILVQLTEFEESRMQCGNVKWKRLIVEPKYIHGLAVLSVSGFKFTRSDMSLDINLEFLSYANIPSELQRPMKESVTQKDFVRNKWFTTDLDSSDDEVAPSPSRRPAYNFDRYLKIE